MIFGSKNRVQLLAGAALTTALLPYGTQVAANEAWLEEIVVTAQKRHETAQEVPIAISAFSEDMIKDIGAQNINDLGRFTPGLETNNTSDTQPTYTVRGIQTNDFGIGTDPAVAVYIDGVYVGRSGSAQMNFNDIQRVEILRGPQGTLFGRNAAAGAISVITKKPTALTEGNIQATVGNYNKVKLEGVYNTELAEGVYGRFGALWNQRDGFIDNDNPTGTGEDTLGQEGNWSLMGSILWDLDADTEIVWRTEYDKLDKDAPYAYSVNPNLYYDPANAGDPYGDYENDSPSFETRELWGTSLTVNHDIDDDLSFISITSYRTFDSDNREDEDGTSVIGRYFDTHNVETNDSFSQEFRLSYHSDGAWSWSTGVSYFHESATQEHRVIFTPNLVDILLEASIVGDGVAPDDQWYQSDGILGYESYILAINDMMTADAGYSNLGVGYPGATSDELFAEGEFVDTMKNDLTFESVAWFGDVTYSFTDDFDATFGLRYTRDSKEMKWNAPANQFGYRLAFGEFSNCNVTQDACDNPGDVVSNGQDWLGEAGTWFLLGGDKPVDSVISYKDKDDDTWDQWTPRMVLNYRWNSDILTYLSMARGFKAGGYVSSAFSDDAFEEEIVDNFELGYKSTLMDSRLRLNIAAFYYEYNDLQILEFYVSEGSTLPTYKVGNGDARASGLETEIQWLALDSLMLTFNSAYLDTEYVEFIGHERDGTPINRADEPISGTPKRSYNIGAEYTLTMGDVGDLVMRFDTSYVSERTGTDTGEKITVDAYALTNARMTYVHVSGEWELALWADNLFDKEYLRSGEGGLASTEGNSPIVRRGTPRFWGLDYRHFF